MGVPVAGPGSKPLRVHVELPGRSVALRVWMAQVGRSKSVAVNILGKVKTVSQLVAIPFLLYNGVLFGLIHTNPVGRILIWMAAFITLWSMVVYLKAAWASDSLK